MRGRRTRESSGFSVHSDRWLDRLLPPVCVVCGDPIGEGEGRVCGLCWVRAPRQRAPRCPRCGIALYDSGIVLNDNDIDTMISSCVECRSWLPYLCFARAPYVMAGTVAAMVRALKYGGWSDLAEDMGGQMAGERFPRGVTAEITAVVPVPLSGVRLRERGYNQAELLAAVVASQRGWPLLGGALVRRRHTRRQTTLAPSDRLANVAGAFAVAGERRARLVDRHLLLVDDVLTTGATVRDCARALCGAGARAVSVLTFARARRVLPSNPAMRLSAERRQR